LARWAVRAFLCHSLLWSNFLSLSLSLSAGLFLSLLILVLPVGFEWASPVLWFATIACAWLFGTRS
jgi:hypothetical protein